MSGDHYDSEVAWDALWTWGNTKAQVEAQVKLNADHEARVARDLEIDDWLRRNVDARCSRTVAGTLCDLEKAWAKGAAA